MVKDIPDRWLNYSPIGKRIPGTRFIAFKVPLRQNVNKNVEVAKRLDAEILMDEVPNLGLIIDLTNTNRYYSPQNFRDNDITHKKLMIPGKQTPPNNLAKKFCSFVKEFLQENSSNDLLIGVHCTHGVNRTGYLICYFMITHLHWAPADAIQKFGAARGHPIERENYLEALNGLVNKAFQYPLSASPTRTRRVQKQHKRSSSYDEKDMPMEDLQCYRPPKKPTTPKIPPRLPAWKIEQQEYIAAKKRQEALEQQNHVLRAPEYLTEDYERPNGFSNVKFTKFRANSTKLDWPASRPTYYDNQEVPYHSFSESHYQNSYGATTGRGRRQSPKSELPRSNWRSRDRGYSSTTPFYRSNASDYSSNSNSNWRSRGGYGFNTQGQGPHRYASSRYGDSYTTSRNPQQ